MGTARADDIRDTSNAETLFRDGKALFAQGRTSDACAKFASSYHIDPQVGTLLFLATCHEAQGKAASAWNEFNAALSTMQVAHNARREMFAQQHLDALSGKLSRLVVTAPSAPRGLQVKLDDQPIESDALGVPVVVDAGVHAISASAADYRPWSTTVEVAQGPVELTVTVPPLERDAAAPPAPAIRPLPLMPPPPPAHGAAAAPPSTISRHGETPPGYAGNAGIYVAGAIGIAGLSVGTATGILAVVDKHDADSGSCAGKYCTQHGLDLYSRATAAAWISTGAFAAGATGVAVAISALLFGRHPQSSDRSGVQVLPTVGGIEVSGAW